MTEILEAGSTRSHNDESRLKRFHDLLSSEKSGVNLSHKLLSAIYTKIFVQNGEGNLTLILRLFIQIEASEGPSSWSEMFLTTPQSALEGGGFNWRGIRSYGVGIILTIGSLVARGRHLQTSTRRMFGSMQVPNEHLPVRRHYINTHR